MLREGDKRERGGREEDGREKGVWKKYKREMGVTEVEEWSC